MIFNKLQNFIYFSLTTALLVATADPPTGNLKGTAKWTDFDGTTACGIPQNQVSANAVAISGSLFDSIDNPCGQNIIITSPKSNGQTTVATIQDSCGDGCNYSDLLLTKTLFQKFYNLDIGSFKVTWHFTD